MPGATSYVQRFRAAIPRGIALSADEWEQRHRWIIRLLWFHVPVIIIFGLVRGETATHSVLESLPTAWMGVLATRRGIDRRTRSMLTGLGLVLASAVLVHLSGGVTEMHFHFFVMIGVISLYQSWYPLLLSVAFVAGHHAVLGVVQPESVFDSPQAWRAPLTWAAIHAFFVLAASAVSVTSWGIVEAGHRRSRAQLEASERRFRALIEHSSDVVTVVDQAGVITYDSPSSTTVLGYADGERVGLDGFSFVHDDDRARAVEALEHIAANSGAIAHLEIRIRHEDGSYRWVEASITNLMDEPAVGGFVANFRDSTDRKVLEDQLAHQAFHDPLTGLANRALLLDRIEHALENAYRKPNDQLALVYIDLDDFKTVNDAFGHQAGDDLLREAADRISAGLRAGDTAARLGGDEFAIVLEGLPSRDAAYEIGARVLESLQAPFETRGGICIDASVGIALRVDDEDAETLVRNADMAMYRAKGEGKGRFEIYQAGMHALVVDRMALRADLRRAVEANEFEPHYQPIVDLESERIIGVEALVRWKHPERGVLSPSEFIPMAEETGLIVQIGSAVLHRACVDAAQWLTDLGDAAPQSVSVNLSPRQIQDPGIVADVEIALSRSGLPPGALTLEITESFLLDDTESAAATLGSLKELGVRIALDDFGTGYSSLTHLDRFPVDVLKIDKTFVDALASTDSERASLVGAVVNLGMMLGLHVTAEGIEASGQLARLRTMGCELGQGYYFAKPMDGDSLREHLVSARPTPAPFADRS